MPGSERHRTVLTDGKQIYLVPKKGHLIVCARGCCCGRTDRGNPAVPIDFYKEEYARRKIRKHVQLTMSGCIGPCPMLNVVQLVFDGRPIWFQSINTESQILELFDYLDAMLAADGYLPPPPQLAEYVFDYYRWNQTNEVSGLSPGFASDHSSESDGGILFFTHADTDIQCLHRAVSVLPEEFPPVAALSLNRLTSQEQMQTAWAMHGRGARMVVVRVLGGTDSLPGFHWLSETVREHEQHLLVLSGTGDADPHLASASTVAPAVLHEAAGYLQSGGYANLGQCLRFLSDHLLLTGFGYDLPRQLPEHGIYHPGMPSSVSLDEWMARRDPDRATVGVLFYRAHWMSGNLAFIDALIREIERRGLNALPVFTSSLKQPSELHGSSPGSGFWPAAFDWLMDPATTEPLVDVLITSLSFAMSGSAAGAAASSVGQSAGGQSAAGQSADGAPARNASAEDVLSLLNVPLLQAINSSATRWQWEVSNRGLNPLDTAMNVSLPELDGRLITVPVSFKERLGREESQSAAGIDVTHYAPDENRVGRVTGLADRLAKLRRTPNAEKRVAFILTNSSGKAAQIGNAVGLDAPASLVRLLDALSDAGYLVDDSAIGTSSGFSDALIHALIDRCSYDEIYLTPEQLEHAAARVSVAQYENWFQELPESQRERMTNQWGPPPGEAYVHDGHIALAGLELGNIFVALQPPRGYGMDPDEIYHQPDLPPPHNYYAMYRWLRDEWGADAIVHLGKHGTLEWLPGKGVGLSADCSLSMIRERGRRRSGGLTRPSSIISRRR